MGWRRCRSHGVAGGRWEGLVGAGHRMTEMRSRARGGRRAELIGRRMTLRGCHALPLSCEPSRIGVLFLYFLYHFYCFLFIFHLVCGGVLNLFLSFSASPSCSERAHGRENFKFRTNSKKRNLDKYHLKMAGVEEYHRNFVFLETTMTVTYSIKHSPKSHFREREHFKMAILPLSRFILSTNPTSQGQ
jgi:hypothetical protein